MLPYFELFQDNSGYYRWRLVAGNGELVATSGESFVSYANAVRAVNRVKELASVAIVIA